MIIILNPQIKEWIEQVIQGEEERFQETLTEGLHILEEIVDQAKKKKQTKIDGKDAFKLYDTYGFPLDLTEDFALEQGLSVDREGFDREMAIQRERARSARQSVDSMQVQGGALSELNVDSKFVGYTESEIHTQSRRYWFKTSKSIHWVPREKECLF